MSAAPSPVRIGLDFGGRVTTVLVQSPHGALIVERLPAAADQTPAARCQAAIAVALRLTTRPGQGPPDLEITYATSATTHALVHRQLPPVVLLATEGFTDVLRIGRQALPLAPAGPPGSRPVDPDPLVIAQPHGCLPVDERLAADGTVLSPLTAPALAALREQVRALDGQAVAVMLLHSYKDPQHEQLVAHALAELNVPVMLSSAVLPVPGEFERASAAVLAGVGAVAQTIEATALQAALPRPARVRKVQSDGAARLEPPPLRALLSDVAAGLVGAHRVAAALDLPRFLSLGVRETVSAAAHHDGLLALTTRARLAGLPVGVPTLAVALRGVGGESPFRRAADDPRLVADHVAAGPQAPRVLDAALVAGRAFAPGRRERAADPAWQRLTALGAQLELTAEAAAAAVLVAATEQLVSALWAVSVDGGHDPADYPLLAYGSAAGLLAAEVAGQLGMRTVLVPPAAGLLTAYGALSAPVLRERTRALRCEASGAQQRGLLEATLRELTEELRRDLLAEGQPEGTYMADREWSADLRYAGQAHWLTLPGVGEGGPAQDGITDLVVRFHQEHQRRYGFTIGERPVELGVIRVRAAVPVAAPGLAQLVELARVAPAAAADAPPAAELPATVVPYAALTRAAPVAGPAVIYEESASTFVPAGWRAELDGHGAIWLRC